MGNIASSHQPSHVTGRQLPGHPSGLDRPGEIGSQPPLTARIIIRASAPLDCRPSRPPPILPPQTALATHQLLSPPIPSAPSSYP